MNLLTYCQNIVIEGRENVEHIADILMAAVDSPNTQEQEFAWTLMRQAGVPFYSKSAFMEAAQLAMEIVNEGPEAA